MAEFCSDRGVRKWQIFLTLCNETVILKSPKTPLRNYINAPLLRPTYKKPGKMSFMDGSKYKSIAKRYCTCKRYKFLPFYLYRLIIMRLS